MANHSSILAWRIPWTEERAAAGGQLWHRAAEPHGDHAGRRRWTPPRDLGRTSLTPSWSSFFPFNPRILLTLLQVSH